RARSEGRAVRRRPWPRRRGRMARAQSRRAGGLPPVRVLAGGNRRSRHRAPSCVAHQVRRSIAGARHGRRGHRRDPRATDLRRSARSHARAMIVLSGGDIVLPDRILTNATLIIDHGRIAAIDAARGAPSGASAVDTRESYIVPGFVDVHVHGVEGHDSLDGADAIAQIAARLPRYGVTAFCPTTVACSPAELETALDQVTRARVSRP